MMFFIFVVSNQSKTVLCEIRSISDKEIGYEILCEENGNHELPFFTSIIQGYPKKDKLEDIIQHGTELGVSEIIPTIMKRSVFKLEEKKKESKRFRFMKIAKEAAEQSNRDRIPIIGDIQYLNQIDFSSYTVKLVCYEEEAKHANQSRLKEIVSSLKPNDRIAIVVGPEGGIAEEEIAFLKENGFIPVSLGKRILRTETVVFYCLSVLGYEWELL